MAKKRNKSRSERGSDGGDYSVGFGKPPVSGRFKEGKSGNPKGRPRGSVNLDALLAAALPRKVKVRVGDKVRSMSVGQAIVEKLIEAAAKGDLAAIRKLFELKAARPPTNQRASRSRRN